ncbi:MAG: cytochrome c oxidase subunit II, partial [Alphaproteobacteria bacterium]|nr:cytochrome c oxidase subunit II [Alphaproteobacteria bacterium]
MTANPVEGRLVYGIDAATRHAIEQDWLFLALLLVSLAVLVLVFGLMLRYVIRYRASSTLERGSIASRTFGYEIAWTAATLVVFFGLFVWGADLYARIWDPPQDALKIYVVGKQWMWKFEHPGGQRELDALHIPVNRPIELMMTSEDVIHSMGIPAFR